MNSVSKSSKSAVTVAEKRRKDRDKERNKLSSKRKLPSDAKSRFGKEFISKLCELFQSTEPSSCERLRQMHNELLAYYKEHDLNVMWISDDETDGKEIKAPLSKKTHQDITKGDIRPVNVSRSKTEAKEKAKPKTENKSSPIITTPIPAPQLFSQFELSDDSDDNTSQRLNGSSVKNYKLCDICSSALNISNNTILECEECGKTVHQKCARPEITAAQVKDPRFLFVCDDCKDREDEKMGTSHSKSTSFRKDDKVMSKSSEEKLQPFKSESDILTTFSNFAAKKAKKCASLGTSSTPVSQSSGVIINKMLPTFSLKDKR
ncbi:unnamed protein product [Thelazia callipaeda]|uniref:PHD-type domain-containing protein n=1 Tax=Thelazia callipaeda TaxID=103827 RepID=A0A0N5D5H8_THECL|nr:unnamed protein product [Thelazia callipaeda]